MLSNLKDEQLIKNFELLKEWFANHNYTHPHFHQQLEIKSKFETEIKKRNIGNLLMLEEK